MRVWVGVCNIIFIIYMNFYFCLVIFCILVSFLPRNTSMEKDVYHCVSRFFPT